MNKTVFAAPLIIALLMGCSGKTLELNVPPANSDAPPAQGLSWLSRAALDMFFRGAVWRGDRSGFVAMFAQDGHPVHATAYGWADIDAQVPMALDTPMRFASMTKPVTAVAAMMLVEDGSLDLDAPVAQYIPAFSRPQVAVNEERNAAGGFDVREPQNPLLVRHLLMFSSGIGPGIEPEPSDLHNFWEENTLYRDTPESLAERIDTLAALPLFEEPGTQWRYGWSADVLARVVEVAAQQPYGEFVQERILTPLGMSSTQYLTADGLPANIATVYTQDENGDLVDSTPAFDAYWTPGGSGLVSTAEDYMRFALMLWNGGEYQGVRLLQAETIDEMTELHMPEGVLATVGAEGIGWGLGMAVTADGDTALIPSNTGDYYWAGYYGTIFFVSPTTGQVGVILSQNEPQGIGEDSVGGPIPLYIAQAIAHAGVPE
ncbi:putative protein [Halioglobus japonicus]|nr:putative protein [Halioglobus japonicus]